MFKYFWSVVGVLLKDQFRAKPTNNDNKQRRKRRAMSTGIVYAIIVLCFSPMLVGIGYLAYSFGALKLGYYAETVGFLVLLCQGVVLMFSFQSILRNVFMCSDGHRLLCLPISAATIFSAKLFVAYIFEVMTSVVMVVTLLLPFGIGIGAGVGYYIVLVLAVFLLPVLPMLIATLLCIPLSMLLTKLNKHNVLRLVFQTFFFLVGIALYMVFINSMYQVDGGSESVSSIMEILKSLLNNISGVIGYVYPVYFIGVAMTSSGVDVLIYVLLSVVTTAVLLALVVLCALPMYRRNLTGQSEGTGVSRRKTKVNNLKQRGIVAELMIVDAKRIFRDKQFALPALLGVIMLPLISVFMFIGFNAGSGEVGLSSFPIYQLIAPLALLGYMLLVGMSSNPVVMYPISRENRCFYLLKTYPIGLSYIFKARLLISSLSILLGYLLTGILSGVLFEIHWTYVLFMTVSMALYAFAQMCIVTLFDLRHPQLNWTNYNQSLKNSRTAWQSMLVSLIVIVALAGMGTLFGAWYLYTGMDYIITLMWVVVIVLGVAFSIVSYKILINNGKKVFDRIEI